MDVKSVFLYGKIEEEVYVCQPIRFEYPDFLDKVYKVEKALYGLHQAPRAWYETLSTYLLDNGFQRGKIDKTLFIIRVKGLQVKQKNDGIFISQDKYMTEILKKFGFTNVKTSSTPMETHKLQISIIVTFGFFKDQAVLSDPRLCINKSIEDDCSLPTLRRKICKKNDVKARSLLLMALPNEHQLTFNQYVNAQSMFVAIKARFGGNEATKRTQKALLKQQYKIFNASSSESLDSIFNRLQKRVSSPSSTNTINTVNTRVSTGTTKVNTASTETSTASFSDATVYAFLSTQPQGSQLVHEDLEQLHDDDLEEMDLKWKNIAPRSKDNRNWNQGGSSKAVRIEDASEKAMCAIDAKNKQYDDLLVKLDDTAFKASTYKRGLSILEGQIIKYKESEVLFSEEIALLKRSVFIKESMDYLRLNRKVKEEKRGFEPSYTAHPKSTVLCARPRTHFQNQAQSTVQRPFYKKTALTKSSNNQNVNTGRQTVNTGRQNVNTVRARGFNVGIKREYSVARTPQQNGVAERKNRTLIEAARTMLADSKLPTTFWAEAVSTACYVQNRVLIVKPHNKTPYELFRGIKPAIGFMKPFGCHVTILNTLDKLGKFDGKSDEGFFVGYSLSSKAFRVYNIRTRKVQENLHVGFLENKPYEEGNVLISSTPHTRIHKDHPIDHVIGDVQSSVQTRRMTTSYSELGFLGAIYEGKTHQDLHTCPTDERKAFLSEKLGSDGDAMTFDEHLYRSMIGSLMYLTASRPDIMFAVDFLASKKNNVVARLLSTEAEYVAVLQVLWTGSAGFHQVIDFLNRSHICYALTKKPDVYVSFIKQFWRSAEATTNTNGEVQITATIDGHSMSITEASLRLHLKLDDQDGVTSIPNSEIFGQLALMGYHTDSDKLTFQKGAFSPQWRFLIHNILHCLSPKKTAWEQFSSNIAAAVICLATNRKFNFSRMIFEHMVSNISSPHKFLMYPRFIQICLDMQRHQFQQHTRTYHVPSLSMKVFNNMKRPTKGYSGQEVALFPTMIDVTAPSTSPSRITSSPSHSPKHSPSPTPSPSPEPTPAHTTADVTQPSPTQPSPTQPSPTQPSPTQPGAEHHVPTPHDSPLHAVHSHGSDEGSLKLNELTDLVTKLSDRIGALARVKIGKARRQARVVLSDDEDLKDDSSKQGRKLSDAEGSEKVSDEVSTAGAKQGTASEEVPIVSTAEVNLSTAGGTVTYSRRSVEKVKTRDKGKAINDRV
ncbi:ribonuclease H-like domain-containing protein [Tanacetum coccineum]